MDSSPIVSVIIPTYQSAKTLVRAINSILRQSYQDFEILVIDNASTDQTKQIVESISLSDQRISYIHLNENLGPSGGRNVGIEIARGKYVAFIDADDEWVDPDKIKLQVDVLDQVNGIGLVFTESNVIDVITHVHRNYSVINKISKRDLFFQPILNNSSYLRLIGNLSYSLYSGNFICLSTVLVRKSLLIQVNMFNPILFGTEDIDLWVRLAKICDFCYLNILTTNYYFQRSSISRMNEKRVRELIKYHKYCKESDDYKAMIELVDKNLGYSYKSLIIEYSKSWRTREAFRAYREAIKLGVKSRRLLLITIASIFGPIPLFIYIRIIRLVRHTLIL